MTDQNYDVDTDLLIEFVDEALDGLAEFPSIFVQLEKTPSDLELVNTVFRPIHTIKGNSAFFGLFKTKELAHEMENVLDLMRKGQLQVTPSYISILLESCDYIEGILSRVRELEAEINDEPEFEKLLSKVKEILTSEDAIEEDHQEKWHELQQKIHLIQANYLPQNEQGVDLLNDIIKLVKELAPVNEALEQITEMPKSYEVLMEILDLPSDDVKKNEIDSIQMSLNALKSMVIDEEGRGVLDAALDDFDTLMPVVGYDDILRGLLKENLEKIKASSFPSQDGSDEESLEPIESSKEDEEVLNNKEENKEVENKVDELVKKDSKGVEKKKITAKTMRIPEETIDTFLSHVGELIVTREMFEHLRKRFDTEYSVSGIGSDFRKLTEVFSSVTSELESSVMTIRKQPVKGVFQKAPRIVRDITTENGKEIDVILKGENIEVDKSLLDILEGPLVHMVRNGADHGIELPSDREAKGKPRKGTIIISMEIIEDRILLSISDDGKGLDFDALKNKAIRMGIINEGQVLNEAEVIDLLFLSGVSTAEKVTDISGRGVGMDVVKRNVEKAGGKISISSEMDKGSVFSISLPQSITTQILQGYIIGVGVNNFVLPVNRVIESFPPDEKCLRKIHGRDEVVERHGKILPLLRLRDTFSIDIEKNPMQKGDGIIVVAEAHHRQIAIFVDRLVGLQQVVLKPLKGLTMNKEFFTGGALMGDGTVSLIIDLDRMTSEEKVF